MSFVSIWFFAGGVLLIWAVIQVALIFRDTLRECDQIENKSFQLGKNMSEKELKKEIEVLRNTKTKFNSFKRMEVSCKIQGLEKVLKEKLVN